MKSREPSPNLKLIKVHGPFRTFEDLDCWKACQELRRFVSNEIFPLLPKEERYRLGDQILRASRSATANIAEGYGRFHYLDNAKFCSNSRGSCYEVLDHLITAKDEEIITDDQLAAGRKHVTKAIRLINGYMKYLKNAHAQTANKSNSNYPMLICCLSQMADI